MKHYPPSLQDNALPQSLVREAMQDMPPAPDEKFLAGRIFDTRQRLVQAIMQDFVSQECAQGNFEAEEVFRDALPPLMLPPIRQVAHFSAWRTALVALLGFVLGLACGQAFTVLGAQVLVPAQEGLSTELTASSLGGLYGGLTTFGGLLGAMFMVWLSEYLVAAKTLGRVRLMGKIYTWKRASRYASWTFLALLILSLARDFMGAKVGVLHLVQGVSLFVTSGQVLPIFTNIYGVLLFVFLFALLLKRPLSFDAHDFAEKLHMAIAQWWAGASLVVPLLQENMSLKHDPAKEAWKKVGMELYSLAGELPEARGQWLEERLRRLGIEVKREEGPMLWAEEMMDRYTPLGHIAVGDACYVDEPPLMEQGLLVRKGTVRKVRK